MRRMTTTTRALLAAFLLAAAAPAAAGGAPDQQLKRLTLEELGEIVITSVSKEPEQIWKTPAAIYVLTHDDVVRSGATSVPDMLRLVPGVEVARIDSSRNWVVGIRGFGDQYSRAMLVLIDGRSIYTPLFAGVHWSLYDLVLDDIERIEIIRGPGGTIWGANAVNGVINIITRSAADTHGTLATAITGNIEQFTGGVRFGAALGPTASYRVYAKAFKRGPEWHSDGRDFDRWHMGRGGFRIDWTRERDTVTVHGDAYAGSIGESVLVASFAPAGRTLVDAPAKVSGQNIVAHWERKLRGDANIVVQGYWDRTDRTGTDFGETRNTFDLDFIHRLPALSRHSISWGAGMRLGPARYEQTIEAADFQPHDQRYDLFSAFAQDSIALPWHFTLTGGAKLEHNTYTGLEVQPSASALWAPTARQSAWLAVTRAVRTPSRIDTDIAVEQFFAAGPPPLYARIRGDRDIKSEVLRSTEAGYRALAGSAVYLDFTVFHHRYDDVVTLGAPVVDFPTRGALTYQRVSLPFANGIEGVVRGLEIGPTATLARNVQVRGSYSYLSPALHRKPGIPDTSFSALTETGSPHHQVVAQGIVSAGNVEVSPVYRYVSRRTATNIPAYHELDVPVSWRLSPRVMLMLVGQNLLNAHHPEWARDPGPTVEIKRSAYVRITWTR